MKQINLAAFLKLPAALQVMSRDVYVLCKGKIVIKGFVVILLALFSALNSERSLFAQNNDTDAQSNQTSTGSRTGRSTAVKRRSRKRRPATKRKTCMPQSPSESTKSESTKSDERQPVMDAPPLILDPTDREPGPPKEIIPKHIDPADMPAIKRPPKKKTNPQ